MRHTLLITFKCATQLFLLLNQGECFGLLGINGAGKTTTFKMMTGDIAATGGDVYLMTYSIMWQVKDAQKQFGYCPQFDALIDQLTVYEILYMYARLRGIAESSIDNNIESIIGLSMLQKHRNKQSGTLRYVYRALSSICPLLCVRLT